ncbi:MAG: kelch repeat-containing protein [Myxococcota bacterium]
MNETFTGATRSSRPTTNLLSCVIGGLIVAACGSDDGAPAGGSTSTGTTTSETTEGSSTTTDGTTEAIDETGSESSGGPSSVDGQWVTFAPVAGGPRQETSVVALEGEVYVLGGIAEDLSISAAVEAYDPTMEAWRNVAELPVPMHHPNAAVVDGRIHVVGFLTGFDFAVDGRAFAYDPSADTWTETTPMPVGTERGASGMAVIDQTIFVIGGLREGTAVTNAWAYDCTADLWLPMADLPQPRDHMVAGAIGDLVYVAGGRDGTIEGHSDRLFIYDPANDEWSEGPPMPTSRGGQAGAVRGRQLFVAGGEGNAGAATGVFESWEVFEPDVGWTVLDPMPTPRHGTGAAVLGEIVFIPGGATTEAFGAVDTHEAWVINP